MPIAGQSPKEVVHTELSKFKHGQLHSGSHRGPIVKNRKQAIAIALSESRRAKRAAGGGLAGMFGGGNFNFGTLPAAMLQGINTPSANGQPAPGWGGLLNFMRQDQGGQAAPTASAQSAGSNYSMLGGQAAPSPAPIAGLGMAGGQPSSGGASSIGGQPSGGMSSAPPSSAMSLGAAAMPPVAPAPAAAAIPPNPPVSGLGGTPNPGMGQMGLGFRPEMGRDMGGMIPPFSQRGMMRSEARSMLHSGPISSIVPGRTDRHNVHVGSGAYVMPADAVSHLGQNNTKAGQAILGHMFGGQGPYGVGKAMTLKRGPGAPKPPGMQKTPMLHVPKFQSSGGGKGDRTGEPVPIVVAGGEFTIPPEAVAAVGGGDIKRGHKILDQWVLAIRKKHIATLKGLPPPAKS